jgi:hypothetical protein
MSAAAVFGVGLQLFSTSHSEFSWCTINRESPVREIAAILAKLKHLEICQVEVKLPFPVQMCQMFF